MASPLSRRHARSHPPLSTLLFTYEGNTPGVECGDNATVVLGDGSEPQPDLYLRIPREHGGGSDTNDDDMIVGPPELIVEIAMSTRSIDLNSKRADYARHGVKEYLVLCPKEQELFWFDLRADEALCFDADGICRIRAFPGLWIDVKGLLARNHADLMATLGRGLGTPEHAEFVTRLAVAKKPS